MDAKRTVLVAAPVALAAATAVVGLFGPRPEPAAHRPEAARESAPAEDVGLLKHRLTVSELRRKEETAALRAKLSAAEAKLRAHAGADLRAAEAHIRRSAEAGGFAAEAGGGGGAGSPLDRTFGSVQELVGAIEGMLGSPDLYRQDVMDLVQDRLAAAIADDPAARDWVLERYRAAAGSDLGGLLAIPLGQVKDPAIEAAAVELARAGGSERHRLAGLELLQRLDLPGAETRQAVVGVLRDWGSAEVLASALYALHREVPGPAETREALAAVTPLTRHADPEVRRRAVIAAADWAADATALGPVLQGLADASPEVRAGAAWALGRARVAAPEAVGALVDRLEDPREDWGVREQAWRALARYPLDERAHAAWAGFESQVIARGEARTEEDLTHEE